MDKSALDFLISSQDFNLLYKHLLNAIIRSNQPIKAGINRYVIDQIRIHMCTESATYNERAFILNVGRIDKYVMEL